MIAGKTVTKKEKPANLKFDILSNIGAKAIKNSRKRMVFSENLDKVFINSSHLSN